MQDTENAPFLPFVRNRFLFQRHVATLTPSQRQFVSILRNWISQPRQTLVLVSGGPGCGKTYAVVKTLDTLNLKVLKMAPTARIAARIGGRTIHSTLKLAWGQGSVSNALEKELADCENVSECIAKSEKLLKEFHCEERPDVIVLDEIGMVANWITHWIVKYFFQLNPDVLIVLMGDKRQLKPVKSQFNIFSSGGTDLNPYLIEMTESQRFTPEYKTVVDGLKQFIDNHDSEGLFDYVRTHFPVVRDVDVQIMDRCKRALAYKNATVDAYNRHYISKFPGPRVRVYPLNVKKGSIDKSKYVDVKAGCDVVVTQNGNSTVTNGTGLVFEGYDATADVLECRLPNTGERVVVRRSADGTFPIVVGFAGTVHKYQGDTIDEQGVIFNFDGCQDVNLIYTALSRVRSMNQILAIVM